FGFLAGRGAEVLVSLALVPIAVRRFYVTRLSATQLAYRLYVASNLVLAGEQRDDDATGVPARR
ncbi:MAG: hypothetical protein GWN07_18530, partial [Actinobacteria bacterium]|nr:hypothetical protein [Actinomycetota bacterium]NIS32392.1 hypothetical protein [Actinomycetota bacterium]NIU67419.1 hypothetical protein [Actinomycetota bacterium]NIW29195.1 hypothetical protein [Actinomycetota bacterium]NIX21720.1 hypothetical protein [Actinomycetota bacterium]